MKITQYSSTNEVIIETGRRIKAVRIAMSVTQKDLAELTGLSLKTISNLENGKDVSFSTVIEVLRSLGELQRLDMMIPEETFHPSQIVELGKPRERARAKERQHTDWKWGDEK